MEGDQPVKQMKFALAIFIALAMATPALAWNFEWHGDFNNRFSYSTQADFSQRVVQDSEKYYGLYSTPYTTRENNPIPNPAKKRNDSDFFGELKYRLDLHVSDDENKVKGVVGFEFGSAKFGGDGADFGGDDDVFELRWAYTDIELPFDPASRLSIGLQPVGYNALLWSDNAGGVKWNRKAGNWAYSLGWFRNDWGSSSNAGGDKKSAYDDAYAADVTYAFDNGNCLNGFVIYLDQGQEDVYILGTDFSPGELQDEEIWLGLSYTGKVGDLSAMATAIYLTGEVDNNLDSWDRSAYLLHGQLDYQMDKTTFTLGALYASGDDDPGDDDIENFDSIDMSTHILGSVVIFDNYADDNSPSQAPYIFDQGARIIYAGVKYALNEKTDVWGKYFWHCTAEDEMLDDEEIGHEFVLGASYKIMKGLSAEINAGYLIAGDALDTLAEDFGDDEADDIFRTDARLRFKF
jgi:hypothetical protein